VTENGGGLVYAPYSVRGDTIPDFSHAGYRGGAAPIPTVPVRITLEPQPTGDDADRMQQAIDEVGRLPADVNGVRGAVLLKAGLYRVSKGLRIESSGVVLRGEGDAASATTVLVDLKAEKPLVTIGNTTQPKVIAGTLQEVTDDFVAVGARRVRVVDASAFHVGQSVFLIRRGNAAWITEIGMDRITGRPGNPSSTRQWTPFELKFDRVVTAVDGSTLELDAPLTCAIDRRWGGGSVVAYHDGDRIQHAGVEGLRAISAFDETKRGDYNGESVHVDENHASYLVEFAHAKNCWVRGVTTVHFTHGVALVSENAKWITVEKGRALAPVSLITGGRRYPFHINGQLTLMRDCFAERARHAFVFGARVCGPNVFLNCRSVADYATSEPHHRWSVGGLYDNVETTLAIQDRQWMGSGHGWSGANYVAWNCRGTLICQQPPTAQNFAIGFVGSRGKDAFPGRPPGWWESEGTPVEPRSLYEAQLRARLGK
jgi:hypothetical protein